MFVCMCVYTFFCGNIKLSIYYFIFAFYCTYGPIFFFFKNMILCCFHACFMNGCSLVRVCTGVGSPEQIACECVISSISSES